MPSVDTTAETCKVCGKERAVRLDDAYGIPVYGFCSEKCAIRFGYRRDIFSSLYDPLEDAVEPEST